jgi:hypothetical protein
MFRYLILGMVAFATAQFNFPVPKGDGTNGSGPYKAKYSTHPDLKGGYTIYSPINAPPHKMPVLLWGNGMCTDQGLGFRNFLNEIASHGYYVIANGEPAGKGKASDQKMLKSLDWVYKTAGTGSLANVDKTKIAVAGQSCGGWQAYKASLDKRVTLTAIFDSGGKMGGGSFSVKQLHAPVGYFLGGTSDMAYRPVS